ncbi:hypothetical protein CRH09_39775 (plasmid) [Nocardia terpenica]|uniref:Uncharacterized protein n=2 Tax=Nocardia terpenica TaxID=455432 RepID=A0A291RZ19_9NOCA|nr:hypothetical protein CRH09_39775 [Nocardia terpenica]
MIGPGGHPPPDIDEADLFAATIADEPVLILLPRFTVTQINEDGALVAADAFEAAIRAHGARPLTNLPFVGGPVPDWVVSIDTTAGVRITGPGVMGEVYDGSLPPVNAAWIGQVAENQQHGRGIVVITGAAASAPAAFLDMIAEGRASWVRAAVELTAPPALDGRA